MRPTEVALHMSLTLQPLAEMVMQQRLIDDWLRAQGALLAAEQELTELLVLFSEGVVPESEVDRTRRLVEERRLLALAVNERVIVRGDQGLAAQVPVDRRARTR